MVAWPRVCDNTCPRPETEHLAQAREGQCEKACSAKAQRGTEATTLEEK